jgi:putative membrane protein
MPEVDARMLQRHDIPFKKNWPLHIMLVLYVIVWIWTAFNPANRRDWLVENILPVLLIAGLGLMYRRFAFSNLTHLLLTVFLILHAIGAHYAYANTPVDIWAKNLLHFKREIYDRMVHFAFGLLLAYPVLETAVRILKMRRMGAFLFAFCFLLAFSSLFELAEAGAVLIADPEQKADFLGLHGDPMDTQKDMLMALIGTLLSVGILLIRKTRISVDG